MAEPQNLPNYHHPDYDRLAPILKLLLDVYNDLDGCKADYLPKEQKEPQPAYQQRVDRAVFNNRLRGTIESNAGLLTAFELTDMPLSVDASAENIDNRGSNYKAFFQDADILALRDGHCYILIDYPPSTGGIETLADQMQSKRKPYLTLIDRRNLLNWRYHHEYGKVVIDSVVFEMTEELPDGDFGIKTQKLYHQLKRTEAVVEHIVWEITDEKNGEQSARKRSTAKLTQTEIPIVCYPYTAKPFCTDNPLFLKLSQLNVKLFRKESSLDEIQHRVNCPTVYRIHPTMDIPSDLPPITFGGNWVIEIPFGGQVGVLEIAGTGIAALQTSIELLKEEIEAEGQAFLSGSRVERTATEAFLSSAQIQASLAGVARDKASAIIRCFDFWCAYTGEENTVQVSMDHSLLEQPLDAQEMGALLGYWQGGVISHKTLLELLKMGKALPPDFNVDDELQQVEEEKAAAAEAAMAAMQPTMDQLLSPQMSEQEI